MKSAETCSCYLCNKLYTYLYHHIVMLYKYIHSNLVYYKHNFMIPYGTFHVILYLVCFNHLILLLLLLLLFNSIIIEDSLLWRSLFYAKFFEIVKSLIHREKKKIFPRNKKY
jgi:hypothetical protein